MSTRLEVPLRVTNDHPALPGHFPGEPVVPGVVLLDRIVAAAEERLGRPLAVRGLPQVKFLRPLLPDEEAIAVLEIAGTVLRFRIERAGACLAQGQMTLAAGESP